MIWVIILFQVAVPVLFSQPVSKDTAPFYSLFFITSRDNTDRMTEKKCGDPVCYPQPEEDESVIFIDDDKTFQTFIGMGGAFTDASAETFYKLDKKSQDEIITAYFDKEKGIGYSLGRIPIHSCDFSSSSFTYVDEGDITLKSFSVKHDLEYRVPFIKLAQATAGAPICFFASPWSPPAWMKTNNNMLRGGKLRPEMTAVWADYYVKFVNEYGKLGIPIAGLTVQNEPMSPQRWESCTFTAEEERDFVKNYLGPALYENGMEDIKLMAWDHNRGLAYQRAKVIYDDPEASKYVWGVAFHWYTGDHFDNIRIIHDAYPDKNLLFSEGCFYPFDPAKINDWQWGEIYGRSIINDLNNWSVGWTDWNLILDEKGGPNHVGNYCYAPVIADTRTGILNYMSSFYYIGHFSKFIKSGAKRIVCSSVSDDLLATAFRNPDGSIITVVMNCTDKNHELLLWKDSYVVKNNLPGHSIATFVIYAR